MTRSQTDELSKNLVRIMLDAEDDILREIAAQLTRDGDISDTSKWRMRQLARAGRLDKRTAALIADYSKLASEEALDIILMAAETEIGYVDTALRDVNRKGLGEYFSEVPAESSALHAAKSFKKQAKSDLNLVNTVMRYKARQAYTGAVNAVYKELQGKERQDVLDVMGKGAAKAVTGQMSLQEATRKTIRELANKGIPAFVDKTGREWSPEAYVMMDMRSTLANTARAAQDMRCDQYGINLIEVSSHMGARPKCAPYQGRIFSRDGSSGVTTDGSGNKVAFKPLSSTSYGQPDGLFGINCGHVEYPYIPGISLQRYFPYDEEENAERYKQFQKQRAMERQIRATKRECMMLQEVEDKEGLKKASQRLRAQKQKYSQFSRDCGLDTHYDRTQVYGYDRSKSAKTVWAERKYNAIFVPHSIKGSKYNISYGKIVGEKPISKQLAKEYSDEYSRVESIFGFKLNVTSVDSLTYQNDDIWGGFNPNSGVLSLFGVGGDDGKQKITSISKEMKENGKWSSSSYLHTFRHELGHSIQKELATNDINYKEKLEKISVIRDNILKDLTGDIESDKLIKKKTLSIYGLDEKATELDEFISESIAEYLNGKPRKTALDVVNILLGKESEI